MMAAKVDIKSKRATRKFSRIDWGGTISESFKASCRIGFGDELNDIREEIQGTNEIDCDSDDHDKVIGRRSPLCLVIAILTIVTAAAVVGSLGFHPDSAISFNWKAMSSNIFGSLSGTVNQQQTDEQALLEAAENVAAACGEATLLRATTGMATCQKLCHDYMCCVEEEEQYSCAGDPSMNCAVYSGCKVLIDVGF